MNKKDKMASMNNVPDTHPPKMQFDKKALARLLSYMKDYKSTLVVVVICILLSAIASAASSLFCRR